MDLRKVYEYALKREVEGRDFFETHARESGHAAAQGVFRRLAAEETQHIAYVERLLADLDLGADAAVEGTSDLQDEGFFADRAAGEMLDQSVIESMVPDVAVLRVAYLIERDIAEFYTTAAQDAQGEAQQALLRLAKWERGHEQLFEELHDRVYKEYTNMPWGG